MNKTKVAILGFILMFLLSFPIMTCFSAEPELGGGRISFVQGQVSIQTKDGEEWADASVNFPIADGDRIMTEHDGKVELNLKNGTYVRIGEKSQLDIIALSFDRGKALIHLNPLEGKIYVNHRPIPEEASSLYIDLPYGVLSSYVPSRFRVDLTPSEAKISVLEGSVEFNRDGRPIPLTQGKTLFAKEGGYAEVAQLYGSDEWDRWNESRDHELFQRRYAQEYLPPELAPYGYDMGGNGRWIYTPDYQYVWVPTVVVGWAPFRHGYWAWRRGIYCWVPYEPWGWIPFHYGRWVHTNNYGWAWVPPFRHAVIWNPGAVAWHIGSTYVSWVPLAPGEIYYGYRYYGPQSVNITRVNINTQKNFYINAKAKDAVMTVQRDSFFRRNPMRITQMENPFLSPVKVSGPPVEKPVSLGGKKATMPLTKESVEKVQPEGKPSLKDLGRDNSSVKRGPESIEQKQIPVGPDKRTINETARNRVERIERLNRQASSTQGTLVKRESTSVPTRERVREESQASNPEGNKNRNAPIVPPGIVNPVRNSSGALNPARIIVKPNPAAEQRGIISNGVKIPNEKEAKYSRPVPEQNVSRDVNRDRFERTGQSDSIKENLDRRNPPASPIREKTRVESPNPVTQSPQRNATVNVNQNRSERAGQTNSSQSLPQRQEGKASPERPSLPEVKLSPVPESKGHVIQRSGGTGGGFLGNSLRGSFR